jgi:hypothetical protein
VEQYHADGWQLGRENGGIANYVFKACETAVKFRASNFSVLQKTFVQMQKTLLHPTEAQQIYTVKTMKKHQIYTF